MPDFIIAGGAKSGTTALEMMLSQHPGVFFSGIKETNYFIFGFEEVRHLRERSGRLHFAHLRDADFIDSEAKYASLFAAARPDQLCGEASPWYLISASAAERIAARLPDVKIVIILRNPADVAFANFLDHLRHGAETLTLAGVDEILNADRYAAPTLPPLANHLRLPRYSEHLPAYLERFPPENLYLEVYEEFLQDKPGRLRRLFSFLGAAADVEIDVDRRVNVSGLPKSLALQRFLEGAPLFKTLIRPLVPRRLRRRVRQEIEAMNTGAKPELPAPTRRKLDALYAEDVAYVEKVLGRRLAVWRDRLGAPPADED
jgi:hypothetical protein